jgi:glycosyltransferase involved in cell wall biosynthesis
MDTCRVLHLIQGLNIGGMEKVTLQLARRSRKRGFDDRILTFDTAPSGPEAYHSCDQVPSAFVKREPGFDPDFSHRLSKLLLRWNVRVLHAHNNTALFYGALAIQEMNSPPALVGTYHNRPCHPTWRARLAARWAATKASHVVAVSEELSHLLQSEHWLHNCLTIPNGVDTEEYRPGVCDEYWRKTLYIPDEALLLCHAGRFDSNKCQGDLIRALRLLPPAVPIFLILAGSGPTLDNVRALASEDRRINFVYRVDDISALLRESDIFIICSKHEGSPCALLEAMACQRAVVATEVGGIPEILRGPEGLCGILVPPANPPALASAIARLCSSSAKRLELGAQARRRIVDSYSIERQWLKYEQLYSTCPHEKSKEVISVDLAT